MTRFSVLVLLAVWPGVLFAQARQPQEFQVSLASTPIVIDLHRSDVFMKACYAWVR